MVPGQAVKIEGHRVKCSEENQTSLEKRRCGANRCGNRESLRDLLERITLRDRR